MACRRLCAQFSKEMGIGWPACSAAAVPSARPPKAKNSLKGAVLEGRCVCLPSARPRASPSPLCSVPEVLWGQSPKGGICHSVKNGTSDREVLPRLQALPSWELGCHQSQVVVVVRGLLALCATWESQQSKQSSSTFSHLQGQMEFLSMDCSLASWIQGFSPLRMFTKGPPVI